MHRLAVGKKNKDVHWYNRDVKQTESERAEEIRKIKELEAQALAAVLGYEPTTIGNSSGPASGSNAIAVPSTNAEVETKRKDREGRRRRKEEKRARKELEKTSQSVIHNVSYFADRPVRHPSRSRSPRYRSTERKHGDDRSAQSRSRSRTPIIERRKARSDYDAAEREREREDDRRRWEYNSRRDVPLDRRRY